MKAFYVTISLILLLFVNINAQDTARFIFKIDPGSLDLSGVDPLSVKEHVLGENIAKKMVLFSDRYTQIIPASPTSPVDKTVIKKPVIYNSIKKLNKHYSSAVKKNELQVEQAKSEFEKCLNIALSIYNKNTELFEKTLKKAKEPSQILDAYNLVVIE